MDVRVKAGVAVLSAIGVSGVVKYQSSGATIAAVITSHVLMSDKDGRAAVVFETSPAVAHSVELYAGLQPSLKCRVVPSENKGYCAFQLSQELASRYIAASELHGAAILTDKTNVTVEFGEGIRLHPSTDDAGRLLVEHSRWIDPGLTLSAIKISCDQDLAECRATLSDELIAEPMIEAISANSPPCSAQVQFAFKSLGSADTLVNACPGQENSGLSKYFALAKPSLASSHDLPSLQSEIPDVGTIHERHNWKRPISRIEFDPIASADLTNGVHISATHELVVGSNQPIQLTREWLIPFRRCSPIDEISNHQVVKCHEQCTSDEGLSSEVSCRGGIARTCGGRLAILLSDPAMLSALIGVLKSDQKRIADKEIPASSISLSANGVLGAVAMYHDQAQNVEFLVYCLASDSGSTRMRCKVLDSKCRSGQFSSESTSLVTVSPFLIDAASKCFHVSLLAQ